MKHATVWTRLLLGSVTLLLLLPACGGGEKKQEKIEITPYILNLHLKYSFIDNFEDGLARVMMKTKTESGRETGVFGCIDEKGHEVIPCIYESVYMEPGGVLVSPKEGDNKLFVYRDGTLQEFPVPDGLEPQGGFYDGRARVHDEDFNYGYIDTGGNLVVPCRYNSADDFSEGLAVIEQNWRKGYIDVDGNEVTPLIYCNAMEFYNGLGCVQNEEGLYGYVDATGREVIPCQFESADFFYGDVAPVCLDGSYGLIDKTGRFVSATRYKSMGVCTSNLFYYGEDGLYGFVDARQNVLTPARYNKIDICREGMVAVAQQDKYGFVNEKGEEVIPCIYSRVNWFDQGFARVARNGRVGYIDKTGREIFLLPSNRFSSASRSGFGVFCFESGGELFIFDEEGNRLDSNGLETPDAASASASAGSDASAGSSAAGGSGVVVVPSVSAPASTGSSQSDPVRRVEWEIRRNRAIEELARLQVKLIEDPNSAYIKHNIQTQQNIINTCNEMIAIYQ